jgi:hypothetical protein
VSVTTTGSVDTGVLDVGVTRLGDGAGHRRGGGRECERQRGGGEDAE